MFWVFVATFGLLCLAGLLVLVRLLLGRSTMDRIVSIDVFLTLLVAAVSVGMASEQDGSNVALLAAVALLGFIGTVTAARLVERKEPYR
ncbi:monovalent cation/H+ antiporter complex subunit F [Bounagaea algeriensis]